MVTTQEFIFPSSDGVHSIAARRWLPEGPPRGVVQLVHGISEHMGRYDTFARFLAGHGFAVAGHDHLGHGRTARDPSEYGWFGEKDGEFLKGSGRSVHGIDLVACLADCQQLLGSWGGHPMAVGVSVRTCDIIAFRSQINATIEKKYGKDLDLSPSVRISMELDPSDVGFELLDELELLHPFGEGNREPIFALKNVVLQKEPEPFGSTPGNYRFPIMLGNGAWIGAVAWRFSDNVPPPFEKIDLAVKLNWNRWNKRKSPQATLIDWKRSE